MAASEVNAMNCIEFRKDVDAWAAGEVSETTEVAMREHVKSCEACSVALATATYIVQQVAADRAPEPDPDFESRILGRAMATDQQTPKRHWTTSVWSGAVAAALVVGVFIGTQFNQAPQPGAELAGTAEPSAVTADPTQKTVRLAFTSTEALEDVTLTLELPPNMELAPFPGRHRVSWKVNLKPGDNLLALPVNILFPGEGTLVAHLGEGTKRKTFRTDIGKETEPSS
ncbi:zf-HC2 domain-containing protein [Marinobacter sp. M216]|uniref:Zf-HC2 domain-containing protein n=1 Tax=Marinobacter albus TaxID=3030833 RepID=A0ABT7HEV4_9GAMM|nr:zf-HC2 domain-containing protein [Marinobacter sp. M216]MDK9558567.1 zf-HC2 domain-containing protein [Marinobacter sp. M216]